MLRFSRKVFNLRRRWSLTIAIAVASPPSEGLGGMSEWWGRCRWRRP